MWLPLSLIIIGSILFAFTGLSFGYWFFEAAVIVFLNRGKYTFFTTTLYVYLVLWGLSVSSVIIGTVLLVNPI